MNRTKIDYLDHTWNPVVGCTPASKGCDNCWARATINKLRNNPLTVSQYVRPNIYDRAMHSPQLFPKRLDQPLKVKKPSMIGVCFMGDLFHDNVPHPFIKKIFSVIQKCPQHVFLILTKRPVNAIDYLHEISKQEIVISPRDHRSEINIGLKLPLSNLWIGVSVEDQKTADERIQKLLQIPAAVRWISLEPMLEGINLRCHTLDLNTVVDYLEGHVSYPSDSELYWKPPRSINRLDWVVVGAESGAKRRPCKLEWIEDIVRQCQDAGIPCFVKSADIDGKLVKMPQILGKVWNQLPK